MPTGVKKFLILMKILNHLKKSGSLNSLRMDTSPVNGIELHLFDGHSEGMAVPYIKKDGKYICIVLQIFFLQKPKSHCRGYADMGPQPLVSVEGA
jgi:hypothetical protein